MNISRLDKQTRRAILITRLAIWVFLIVAGYAVLASSPGVLPPLKGIALSEILSLLALGATVVIAYLTWRSAQAAERSAQVSERSAQILERTYKAANDSVLGLEFVIVPKVLYPVPDLTYPSTTRVTPELTQLRADWERLTPEQARTRKHGFYATVKNFGPSVARRVSCAARVKIAQPNVGIFTKDVRIEEIPILQVGYRQNVLAHVFDEVSDQCRVGLEHATIIYTTSAGETRTDEWSHCRVLSLGESPIRGFDSP